MSGVAKPPAGDATWAESEPGNREGDRMAVKDEMIGICKVHPKRVRPGGKSLDDDQIVARLHPVPDCVVKRQVQVSDPRHHLGRSRAEYRRDLQIVRVERDDDSAVCEGAGQGSVDAESGDRLDGRIHGRT